MSFPPSAACKFLDLPPVNLRNLHLHLTKNPFASRPPHLCGVTLKNLRNKPSSMGVSAPKGSRGRSQTFVCFHCPLVAPAGAVPPATIKIKKHGCALRRFPKGDRRLRLFSLPFGRLRRGEIPRVRERTAMVGSQAAWSRPSGATQHSWSKVQLGGAPAGARSYWQGRFAACAFVGGFLGIGRTRNCWGVAPNPTRDAVP